jgi:hypothetical protein
MFPFSSVGIELADVQPSQRYAVAKQEEPKKSTPTPGPLLQALEGAAVISPSGTVVPSSRYYDPISGVIGSVSNPLFIGSGAILDPKYVNSNPSLLTGVRYIPPTEAELALSRRLQEKEGELLKARQELNEAAVAKKDLAAFREKFAEVARKELLKHLIGNVEPAAQEKLLASDSLEKEFGRETCFAYVMSIDIRKSTDLMLKATHPKEFATFIVRLCTRLKDTVLNNHGVFDKFTGDGILAFFPDFYSGEDAGYLAIRAADQCHQAFREEYERHRSCFSSVRSDAGLGIGIDCGSVALLAVWGSLTVVGPPVVYACRFGGAPAGYTYLNQQAYSNIFGSYSAYCSFHEASLSIKNEGEFIAYDARLNEKQYSPKDPDWMKPETKSAKK